MDELPEQETIGTKCSPGYAHYKYKQELSQKGIGEKTEASFKFMCDVWGYQSFFFAVILFALVFHKHAYDFLRKRGVKIGEPSAK